MARAYTNFAKSTLASGITNVAVSLTVGAGEGALFPAAGAGTTFDAVIYNTSGTREIVSCTSRTGDVLTIVRGQQGTTAVAWNSGDKIGHRLTASALNSILFIDNQQQNTGVWCGTAGGTANALTLTPSSAVTAMVAGHKFIFKASANANTTAATMSVSGLAAFALQNNGAALVAGNIEANKWYEVLYDGAAGQLKKYALQSSATSVALNTVTLTSGSPSATLTASSDKQVRILTDTTKPINPSIVMPDMTTMTTGGNVFTFENTTPYPVALKDSGGTIREFVPPYSKFDLTITSIASATGAWFLQNPQAMVGDNLTSGQTVDAPYPVNAGYNTSSLGFVQLNSTNFAWVWSEQSGAQAYVYAKLYTINTTTQVITVGNRVTVASPAGASSIVIPTNLVWDTDNAGRAFCQYTFYTTSIVCPCNPAYANYASYFGLSVTGGTLSASAVTSVTGNQAGYAGGQYVMYLGSSNAFAYGFALYQSTPTYNYYYRMATVTGTTPTITESASNTSFAGNAGPLYSRTSLTGSTVCLAGVANKAIAYNPGANTFTSTNRTVTTATLDIEQGSLSRYGSFGMGGFMYASGKVMFGPYIYDITNDGAAGVTAVNTAGANLKTTAATSFQSLVAPELPALRVGLPPAATDCQSISVGAVGGSARLNNLNSSATFDGAISGTMAFSGSAVMSRSPLGQAMSSYNFALMMDTTNALFFKVPASQTKIIVAYAKIATPII